MRFSRLLSTAVVASVVVALLAAPGGAAEGDRGYEGPSFTGTSTPTGQKRAESILWWNDGHWWANMWNTATSDFEIFKLDVATQQWQTTTVKLDRRAQTHADVLWDGTHLYVASHKYAADGTLPVSGWPAYLHRFSYDATTDTYSPDAGFPVQINDYNTESLVIDKDSTGTLWATWMQDNKIYVSRTIGGDDATWGTPFVLPVDGTTVDVDDISSVVAFGGNKIGVMWSNQIPDAVYFAVHVDGDPAESWSASRTAIQGPRSADDHINLKSLQSDGSGRVIAAVKTQHSAAGAPLIMLLVRDATTGDWESHVVGTTSDCHNRPIVMIDTQQQRLHVFATAPSAPDFACNTTGGTIYEKTSPLNAIAFEHGYGTAVMHDADSAAVHNASSTKQSVTSETGLVVLASNGKTSQYWHHYDPLTPPAPEAPTAAFEATPTSGTAPLAVAFTDRSTGAPTAWSWNFGDGSSSTEQNPAHTYTQAGTYTVTLTVTSPGGTHTTQRVDYISVVAAPDFSLNASPTKITIVRGQTARYTITMTALHGFTGDVSLAVAGIPQGATAVVSPNPTTGSATLTITTTVTTKQGGYTLTITGTNGDLSRTTTATLLVKK